MASGLWPGSQSSHEPPWTGQANAPPQDDSQAYLPSNAASHNAAIRKSYEHNNQTIPGLALSFSGGSSNLKSLVPGTATKTHDAAFDPTSEDVEEGEISEDELEDIYEPQEPNVDSLIREQHGLGKEPAAPPASDLPRDRSGSYSPYLSPGEMDTDSPEPPQTETTQPGNPQPLEVMKRRAQDAILRLKLANVQYQDFIDEGIDRNIVDQLFRASGLDIPAQEDRPVAQPLSTHNPAHTAKMPDDSSLTNIPAQTHDNDKGESRKDRIARLLAAKGSKSGKVSASATVVGKVSKPSPIVKVNSEKSKLLQMKMEALLKAREAQKLERIRQDATDTETNDIASDNGKQDAVSEEPNLDNGADAEAAPLSASASSSNLDTTTAKTAPGTMKNRSGLKASSVPFTKPFGHNRESRPFLIDVSDDDDDTDMEMESPEQHLAQRSTSPRVTRPRAVQDIRDEDVLRQLSSPGSLSTPPLSKDVSRPDLVSMNKKIEAMKLKIAEAEARKKARLSQQATPSHSPIMTPRGMNDDVPSGYLGSASPTTSVNLRGVVNDPTFPGVKANHGSLSPQATKGVRSRTASERLPLLESRRREQLLKLKALQSQVANIERELKEGLAEEERLREDLDYISDDDFDVPATGAQPILQRELLQVPSAKNFQEYAAAESQQTGHDDSAVVTADQIVTEENSPYNSTGPLRDEETPWGIPTVAEEDIETQGTPSETQDNHLRVDMANRGVDENDATMQDVQQASGDDADYESDGYEPPGATASEAEDDAANAKSDESLLDAAGSSEDAAAAALNAELISAGRQGSVSETERQAPRRPVDELPRPARAGFIPYDSPLRYFHAFRFHPLFNDNVEGGLRSATYSNKIDAQLPLCPDEAAGQPCPRGTNCHFQHFDTMKAPDDQILLQLGAYSDCDASKKEEYISGLRQLLTDFRNQKVKDFDTISQGIIQYRNKFHGDDSKILPLGPVSL